MKVGKIPENVLKRSILKKIVDKRSEVLVGAGVGEDCAFLRGPETSNIALSTCTLLRGFEGFYRVINNLAASGARATGVLVNLTLPSSFEEADLKALMDKLAAKCKEADVALLGGHTEVSSLVNAPIVSITAVGESEKPVKTGNAKPGNDLVLTKWIGLEGTAILARERKEELLKKFPDRYIYDAENFDKLLSVVPEAATAIKSGVTAMHDLSTGGVFSGLWELAESSGVGLITDLRAIPVKQETIEICNYFDINPYELASAGALLIACEDGEKLLMDLNKEGFEATIIGKVTDSNDRVVVNGDITRFLEPSKTDEILKVIQ